MKIPAAGTRSRFTVDGAARILKRFYFIQRELVLMQAAWIPGTPWLDVKLALAQGLWQDSVIAGLLRQRVLELRYPERRIEADGDEALLQILRMAKDAPNGASFFHVLQNTIKPLMESLFQTYLDATDHLDDLPTVRILRQALVDLADQQDYGTSAVSDLPNDAVHRPWTESVDQLMKRLPALDLATSARESTIDRVQIPTAIPFALARTAARDPRFSRPKFAWPDRLNPARGAGEGFELQIRAAVHHLNEVWAMEMAAAVITDLADEAPHEFLEEAARWCFDESRHCRMGFTRLGEFGYRPTEIPLDSFSYDAGASLDPLARLGIIFYFETTYIHTKSERTKIFAGFGDQVSSHDMDYDWADELIHTYYGNKWLKFFLEKRGDPRTPKDIKLEAERAVEVLRATATDADREETESHYLAILEKGKMLAHAA